MSQEVRKLQFISPSLTPPEGSAMPATDTDDQFGTRKGPTSVDPLLTAEEVALRLRVSKGLGPFFPKDPAAARHPHGRWRAAVQSEPD
jgi:hypothetical protein